MSDVVQHAEVAAFVAGFERGCFSPGFSTAAEALADWRNSRSGLKTKATSAQALIDAALSATTR